MFNVIRESYRVQGTDNFKIEVVFMNSSSVVLLLSLRTVYFIAIQIEYFLRLLFFFNK